MLRDSNFGSTAAREGEVNTDQSILVNSFPGRNPLFRVSRIVLEFKISILEDNNSTAQIRGGSRRTNKSKMERNKDNA